MSEANSQQNTSSDTSVRVEGVVRGTAHELIHPATVGELRRFLEPFADDCQLMAMNWGAFRYVLDGEGNGIIQYT